MSNIASMEEMYQDLSKHARLEDLKDLESALSYMNSKMLSDQASEVDKGYFDHAVAIAWMIMDLMLPLSKEEEDCMLAAAVCHILPERFKDIDIYNECRIIGLDERIPNIISLITRQDGMDEEQTALHYENLKKDKLALIIRLVDRSNLIGYLHGMSKLEAKAYINETKKYFLPICIYAKEHYPQIQGQISIVMEKMRTLLQVMEILFAKYEIEENALNDEILSLTEENSRLRGIIKEILAR